MARPSDVDYRDLEKTTKDPETGEVLSLRERRAGVVRDRHHRRPGLDREPSAAGLVLEIGRAHV